LARGEVPAISGRVSVANRREGLRSRATCLLERVPGELKRWEPERCLLDASDNGEELSVWVKPGAGRVAPAWVDRWRR